MGYTRWARYVAKVMSRGLTNQSYSATFILWWLLLHQKSWSRTRSQSRISSIELLRWSSSWLRTPRRSRMLRKKGQKSWIMPSQNSSLSCRTSRRPTDDEKTMRSAFGMKSNPSRMRSRRRWRVRSKPPIIGYARSTRSYPVSRLLCHSE